MINKIKLGTKRVQYSENFITCPGNSINEIRKCEGVIDNYAKHKSVKIRFFDPREMTKTDEFVSPVIEDIMANSVGIEVEKKSFLKPAKKSWNIVKYFKREDENKPFMREVYEKIQTLCDDKSPIEGHKQGTIEKLVAYGKLSCKNNMS